MAGFLKSDSTCCYLCRVPQTRSVLSTVVDVVAHEGHAALHQLSSRVKDPARHRERVSGYIPRLRVAPVCRPAIDDHIAAGFEIA